MLTHYLFYINRIENTKNNFFLNYPGNVQELSRISKNPNFIKVKIFCEYIYFQNKHVILIYYIYIYTYYIKKNPYKKGLLQV